jgi:hypothetical protein
LVRNEIEALLFDGNRDEIEALAYLSSLSIQVWLARLVSDILGIVCGATGTRLSSSTPQWRRSLRTS